MCITEHYRRHFIDDGALQKHFKTKPHKRRYCVSVPPHPWARSHARPTTVETGPFIMCQFPSRNQHYSIMYSMAIYIYTVSLLLHFPSPSPLPPPHTHSTRLQALKEPVYTQKEAEMAAGMGNYVLQQPDTNITNVDMDRTT